jgi:Bacterial Ig-like domain (group 3)
MQSYHHLPGRIQMSLHSTSRRVSHKRLVTIIVAYCVVSALLFNTTRVAADSAPPRAPASQLSVTATPLGSTQAHIEISSASSSLPSNLHVQLNGQDASGDMQPGRCDNGSPCLSATLSQADGLRAGKNVIGAYGTLPDGRRMSGRARFSLASASSSSAPTAMAAKAQVNAQGMPLAARAAATQASVASPFLPPTVSFKTNNAGGYSYGGNSWITLGQTQYPTSNPQGCSGTTVWTAIVFDRTQLTEKTQAPENSPACFSSSAALTQYLQGLPAGDLVIAGTNYGQSADLPLDTSAIGGNVYQSVPKQPAVAGYMIIGATGATPGTAYEARFAQGLTGGGPQAFGILQEDAGGNYNFLPSEVIRYVVMPNAPAGAFHSGPIGSAIQMSTTAQQQSDDPAHTYRSYAPPSGIDGFWLLRLSGATLEPLTACGSTSDGGNVLFETNCGTFYPTNSTTHDAATSQSAYLQLAQDLTAAYNDPWQLVLLTTVGNATCCDWMSAVAAGGNIINFSQALISMGGTMALTTYPQNGWDPTLTSAYTLVTASGLGNAQSGPVAESSTVLLNDHGQTGTIMGTLQRNNNAGLFAPADINQQYPQLLIENGGLDNQFVTTTVALQQPVTWPALDQNNLLAGADSITGQINAYRFISYSLLTNQYMVGASGSHLDDLHFFFTGSTATSINYHYFDPINMPWPGTNPAPAGFTPCNSVTPGNNGDDTCNYSFSANDSIAFTHNDFVAVQKQTSLEVRNLTNVLVYFLTGSTNLKDVMISGNSSVGVALTGAASTIIGSDLVPNAATTTVSISWESILGGVNGLLTIASGVPGIADLAAPLKDTEGLAAEVRNAIRIGGAISNEVAGGAGLASGAGAVASKSGTHPLPAKYSKFAQTIGQLADGALANQIASGFDAVVDSITSDWARLANIGPRVVNSDDPAFFSPTQSSQAIAINASTASASRQFYLALMPTLYQVHYWHAVAQNTYFASASPDSKINQPDMMYGKPSNDGCPTLKGGGFYMSTDPTTGKYTAVPDYISIAVATVGGQGSSYNGDQPFINDPGPIDYYVIAEAPTNLGASSERIDTMDPQLASTLFSAAGLALPMQQFVSATGPMAASWYDAGVHTNNKVIGNIPNAYVFSYWTQLQDSCFPSIEGGPSGGASGTAGVANTTTTLIAPGSALIGSTIAVAATVSSADGSPVSAGTVYFMEDGVTISTAALSAGTARATLSAAAIGSHTLSASFASEASYEASDAPSQAFNIYADDSTISVSTSVPSLTTSAAASAVSDPVTVTVNSNYGATGNVSFACSGLPLGLTCNFSPDQVSLSEGGKAMSVMTIRATTATSAALFGVLFLLPAGLRRGRSRRTLRLWVMTAATIGLLAGCSGDKNYYPQPAKGTVTVLVSATLGSVTQTTPLQVTLQ